MGAGLDAYGPIPVGDLAGYDFVGRYVSQQAGKCVTADEVHGYLAAGKSVVLFYEDNADDGLGGAAMGAAKAQFALPILDALGWPAGVPVYFTFDMPGYAWDLPTFVSCAQAFAAGIGRPAAMYGDVSTCQAGYDAGIRYLMQFGEGRASGIDIYQSPSVVAPWGQDVDPDASLATDYGQWDPNQPPPPEEEEMKGIFATGSKGGLHLVAPDCQSKQPIPTEPDVFTQLMATGQYIDMRTSLDHGWVDSIPVSNG